MIYLYRTLLATVFHLKPASSALFQKELKCVLDLGGIQVLCQVSTYIRVPLPQL